MKSFNTARMVKQMSTLMLKYAIYAFSVEKQLKSVLNIWNVKKSCYYCDKHLNI